MEYRENKIYNDVDASAKIIENITFADCRFINCKFKASVLHNVTFNECTFDNCVFISAVFDKSEIKYCSFIGCTLIGMNWSALSSDIAYSFEKIENCLFKYNDFVDMNLKKLNFGKSEIISSTFHQTNLSDSNFSYCNLENTTFSVCDLQKSDFRLAQGFNIDITTCKMKGARFSANNLTGLVKNLGIKIE